MQFDFFFLLLSLFQSLLDVTLRLGFLSIVFKTFVPLQAPGSQCLCDFHTSMPSVVSVESSTQLQQDRCLYMPSFCSRTCRNAPSMQHSIPESTPPTFVHTTYKKKR
ncbi:hypothetical protein PMIN04_001284 [Paraphaeosphaeria minitans]